MKTSLKLIVLSLFVLSLLGLKSLTAGPVQRLLGMQESPEDQLAKVAKDWTGTIRTLKIIPVFPLREDITPGDVFLVSSTAEEEAKEFKKSGFLAPDVPITRLLNIDYASFYKNDFLSDEFTQMPHSRNSTSADGKVDRMPTVSFPVFTFKSLSKASLASAFPINGIPIALNWLSADEVSGSISIGNARSYGADASILFKKLREWARDEDNKELLKANYEGSEGNPVYLRIVTHVYLAGGVTVSLERKSSSGSSGQAANPPKVGTPTTSGTPEENEKAMTEALNQQSASIIEQTQVGGKITFTNVTGSRVSMTELFQRRQVVGYLGYDIKIGPEGTLGAQRSTNQRLRSSTTGKSRTQTQRPTGSPKANQSR